MRRSLLLLENICEKISRDPRLWERQATTYWSLFLNGANSAYPLVCLHPQEYALILYLISISLFPNSYHHTLNLPMFPIWVFSNWSLCSRLILSFRDWCNSIIRSFSLVFLQEGFSQFLCLYADFQWLCDFCFIGVVLHNLVVLDSFERLDFVGLLLLMWLFSCLLIYIVV